MHHFHVKMHFGSNIFLKTEVVLIAFTRILSVQQFHLARVGGSLAQLSSNFSYFSVNTDDKLSKVDSKI